MTSFEFAMKLLQEANVAVSPGGGFRTGRRRVRADGPGGK